MSDLNNVLDELCVGIDSVLLTKNDGLSIGTYTKEENGAAVMAGGSSEEPCVCGACVMCKNATTDSNPVHMIKDGERVELSGRAELNKKDILMETPFAGCETTEDMICGVKAEDIEDGEWQDVDETKNQGKDKETLKSQSSYMVCTKGWGIIYFVDAGQQVKDFADELSTFLDHLQKQFGFDRKTVGILGQVYRKIQEEFSNLTQRERDWYFARALSQMGDYDNKWVTIKGGGGFETHAWRRGAGQAIGYGEENHKKFFCDTLGIDEADYKYMRQMVRLQHLITSNFEDKYRYDSVYNMSQSNETDVKAEFQNWKKTMEEGTGKELKDDEYLELYKQIYDAVGTKGDFSHMLYTISANLIDKGHEVDNRWSNLGAGETSWKNAEQRKDVAGWLGDAVYDGDGKVSFGMDDYIADLDADNIAHLITEDRSLVDAANEYYRGVEEEGLEYRTKTFVDNNTYEEIEKAVMERLRVRDVNGDKKKDYLDLLEYDAYLDTYKFLARLQ